MSTIFSEFLFSMFASWPHSKLGDTIPCIVPIWCSPSTAWVLTGRDGNFFNCFTVVIWRSVLLSPLPPTHFDVFLGPRSFRERMLLLTYCIVISRWYLWDHRLIRSPFGILWSRPSDNLYKLVGVRYRVTCIFVLSNCGCCSARGCLCGWCRALFYELVCVRSLRIW